MSGNILVVDDDIALAKTVEAILRQAGHAAVLAHTAEDGVRLALNDQPDLVLLDVMVPNMGGWEACRRVREQSDVPIIFLTALGQVNDVVRGLEIGADDYIVKPFNHSELLARVMAHLRRRQTSPQLEDSLHFGNSAFVINMEAHTVEVDGRTVELTPREFQLLAALAYQAGRVVPTADLVKQAWGLKDRDAIDNIKPYIHYLRKKLETDPAAPRWILTVRGVGYRLAPN
ncbi:MAG: response regulator [Anaerolineae bacterium]